MYEVNYFTGPNNSDAINQINIAFKSVGFKLIRLRSEGTVCDMFSNILIISYSGYFILTITTGIVGSLATNKYWEMKMFLILLILLVWDAVNCDFLQKTETIKLFNS